MATLQQLAEVDTMIKNEDGTETIKRKVQVTKYDYVVIDSLQLLLSLLKDIITLCLMVMNNGNNIT